MDPRAADVLDFWFGPQPGAARAEWFRKNPDFDATIARRFGALIEQALAAELASWADEPASALAQVLLLDQFTRNVFRGGARSFAGDARALAAARAIVARGWDAAMTPVQRWFVYLPFEHAEDVAAQAQSMALFGRLAEQDASMADALEWARRHQEVIARFGRFPHRNEVLGRASTPEEIEFLRQPGSSF
jgi:uncharacterized protein (DUF924 family)